MKNLIILCLFIFSSCHSQKQFPDNQWSEPITIRDYSSEATIIGVDELTSSTDSTIFRASIKPSLIVDYLDKISYYNDYLDKISYYNIMKIFMSSTEQAHYDLIYFTGQAPVINPRYQEGRFDPDYLRLLIRVSIDYKGKSYSILKVKENMFLNKIKNKNRTFVLIKNEPRGYHLLIEYPDKIRLIENLVLEFTEESTYLLFHNSKLPKDAKAAIRELRQLTLDDKRNTLDFELVLLQIEEWKRNKQTDKLNALYEK